MGFHSDVDIDLGNRDKILSLINHIPAAMKNVTPARKHASGVYVTEVPYDPVNDMASIDYAEADERGYFKLDLLNMHVYERIDSEAELYELMKEPKWELLNDKKFVEQLVHLNNSFYALKRMPEPIDSIPRLAMFLAVIRPSKKHLIGETWKKVNETVWEKDDTGYAFKRSHAVAYAQLVVVHMNILAKQL